ncbi:MAG: fructose-specific PTS transporter subunit EIIC [Ruminococcus sp.]|nr:fructose-specific PTS transporter subunit EIIC [Ruminococcus sp.]
MRIVDLLSKNSITLNAAPKSKAEAIDMLVDLQVKGGKIADREAYKKGILAREEMSSTAVGEGIAIPHAKSTAVKAPSLAAMTVPQGVDYEAMDDEPSNLLFMIAAPNDGDVHLEVLSRLMTILMDEDFREKLLAASSKDAFLQIIDDMEKEKYPDEPKEAETAPSNATYKVLAVTACPTGIAHTYMAAEALEKAGKKLGITIKVETNGSGGAKNVLTKEEIAACDGIIVAADKTVEMARFDGKKVIRTKVSDGIKIPEELINRIEAGDAPVYHHAGEKTADSSSDGESFGRKLYKHLMNGVSNMLPFTVAGGIFIALAFLIDTLAGAPQNSDFGTYTAAAAFFKTIGGFAFNFMIPVLAGYIGKSIADRPGFLVGLVGGYLATTGSTFSNISGKDAIPSGFLGALLAGFVGGFLMLMMEKLCDKMPKALNGIKPVLIYPLAGLGIIAVIMCAVNPFMGMINTGLSDLLNSMGSSSKIVLGCILGAMMSIDMGGPFNKAAYVFGTAAIASGSYDIMAAVMIGGMVPPIAIALSTTFFKNRWTAEERKNGPVNYIMGLSFITEGAIPYAAADPMRVIPSCMVGAAVAGGMSMAFDCTLMAPHGGIFVFAVVGNWAMYLLSLVVGSLVGMLMLALLKKKRVEA